MDFRRLIEHARKHAVVRPKSLGQRLATGQQPTVLFITCADSRIVTSAITGAEPGTVFELRTAGNVIPPYRLEARPAKWRRSSSRSCSSGCPR